jgi:hypothetical protein
LLTAPLLSLGTPAQADNGNNFVGQAQRFLNNRDDDSGYDRGRDNEIRRPQAERDGYGSRRDDGRRQQAERDHYQRNDDRAWNSDDRDRPGYGGDSGNNR